MGDTARVTSVEAVKQFREAMLSFCETVQAGLCANEMEGRRVVDRLLSERPGYWAQELRARQEEVSQAQVDLHRIKLQRAQGYRVDDIEQRRALELAKHRVEEAEEKLEAVRRWSRVVQQAMDEYTTRARRLADLVEGNPPPCVLTLNGIIESLDAYLRDGPLPAGTGPVRGRSASKAAAPVAGGPSKLEGPS